MKPHYIIKPEDIDVPSLYQYLISNLTFDEVVNLYIMLRDKLMGCYKENK